MNTRQCQCSFINHSAQLHSLCVCVCGEGLRKSVSSIEVLRTLWSDACCCSKPGGEHGLTCGCWRESYGRLWTRWSAALESCVFSVSGWERLRLEIQFETSPPPQNHPYLIEVRVKKEKMLKIHARIKKINNWHYCYCFDRSDSLCMTKTLSFAHVARMHGKKAALTGNLHFSAALHYSTHSVSHNAAVVAGVWTVQRGNQVSNGCTQHKCNYSSSKWRTATFVILALLLQIHTPDAKLIEMFHWALNGIPLSCQS